MCLRASWKYFIPSGKSLCLDCSTRATLLPIMVKGGVMLLKSTQNLLNIFQKTSLKKSSFTYTQKFIFIYHIKNADDNFHLSLQECCLLFSSIITRMQLIIFIYHYKNATDNFHLSLQECCWLFSSIIARMLLTIFLYHYKNAADYFHRSLEECCWLFTSIITWMLLIIFIYH